MTTLNDAWTEPGSVLDLFLESFRIGNGTSQLLNHLVFITMGQKAHERCTSMRGHCFDLNTKGANLSEQKDYNTPGYLDITWQRLDFQRQVLEKGYDFIFTVRSPTALLPFFEGRRRATNVTLLPYESCYISLCIIFICGSIEL